MSLLFVHTARRYPGLNCCEKRWEWSYGFPLRFCEQRWSLRFEPGKSRNKVPVGEPADGLILVSTWFIVSQLSMMILWWFHVGRIFFWDFNQLANVYEWKWKWMWCITRFASRWLTQMSARNEYLSQNSYLFNVFLTTFGSFVLFR